MSAELPRLGLVGAGRVGATLARALHARGVTIAAIHSRTAAHAAALAAHVDAVMMASPVAVAQAADLTLLTVPDDALATVVAALAGADLTGRAVVHTSGALDARVLAPLVAQGAAIGSLHPAYPFADADTALSGLAGAAYALEAEDARLAGWLRGLVAALAGQVIAIPPGGKAAYHAALVIASNYMVTLYAVAERVLLNLGAERSAVAAALNTLVLATAHNLSAQGIPDALTGPLVRGDAGTVAAHLAALEGDVAEVYRQLARLTLPLLIARGTPTEALASLLDEGNHHAIDNP